MELHSILSATLGLSPPWQVTSVSFGTEPDRLDIWVEYSPAGTLVCPACNCQTYACTASSETETWYHEDFFRHRVFLHARIPQPDCRCSVLPAERPWCRAGSRFALVPDAPHEEPPDAPEKDAVAHHFL